VANFALRIPETAEPETGRRDEAIEAGGLFEGAPET